MIYTDLLKNKLVNIEPITNQTIKFVINVEEFSENVITLVLSTREMSQLIFNGLSLNIEALA
jgi:hypothetical protein